MNALSFLAPVPLALLLGSAVLPESGKGALGRAQVSGVQLSAVQLSGVQPSGVQVVNHTGDVVRDVQVCLAGSGCQKRARLAAGERWQVTAQAGSRPLRLTVGREPGAVQLTDWQRGRGLQLALKRDSQATTRQQ